jgi:hypothetical protein
VKSSGEKREHAEEGQRTTDQRDAASENRSGLVWAIRTFLDEHDVSSVFQAKLFAPASRRTAQSRHPNCERRFLGSVAVEPLAERRS